MTFRDEVEASLPRGLVLPAELRTLLDWMEPNGFVHTSRFSGERYASLYPFAEAPEGCVMSHVHLHPVDPGYAASWAGIAEAGARLAPIVTTGGDGSRAALWLDDAGAQHVVHLGSGSGSTLMCVLTSQPLDLLRLLAIGYEELCWPPHFELTPEEVFAEEHDEDETLLPPLAFRSFVETQFGVVVPEIAAEIVQETADMDAPSARDPFWLWLKRRQQR
jgi:hypothetical protein